MTPLGIMRRKCVIFFFFFFFQTQAANKPLGSLIHAPLFFFSSPITVMFQGVKYCFMFGIEGHCKSTPRAYALRLVGMLPNTVLPTGSGICFHAPPSQRYFIFPFLSSTFSAHLVHAVPDSALRGAIFIGCLPPPSNFRSFVRLLNNLFHFYTT